MIIAKENRKQTLIKFGVPEQFINALEQIDQDEVLADFIRQPEVFYDTIHDFYDDFDEIKNYDIVPIAEDNYGNQFYVCLFNSTEYKFVTITNENGLLHDYGSSFQLMLADIIIEIYEVEDDIPIEELSLKANFLGAKFGKHLLQELDQADNNNLRASFELNEQWKAENLMRIINENQ